MTYKELFSRFLNHIKVFNTEETFKYYKSHVKNILKYFDLLDPMTLNYDNLINFVIYSQTNKVSNATINKRIGVIKYAFKHCKIVNQDLNEFPKLKQIDKRFNALTIEEIKKLLLFLKKSKISSQNKAFFSIFLFCGVRLSELTSIKAKNVNFKDNCILLEHTKTYKQRYVFFTEECKKYFLLPYFKTIEDITNDTPLFTISKNGIASAFERANKQLHFKKFTPHVLRHTYATLLVANNANLNFIATTLGHSNLEMTKRYLHQDIVNNKKIYKNYFNYSIT